MNIYNKKGEITTILTLITFLVIGISSIISTVFLKNNKNKLTTSSKAMETCECDYGCYSDGTCKPAPNEPPLSPATSLNNSPGCGPDNPELCVQQQNNPSTYQNEQPSNNQAPYDICKDPAYQYDPGCTNEQNPPQQLTPTEISIEQPTPIPTQSDYCQQNPWDCNGNYLGPPTEAPPTPTSGYIPQPNDYDNGPHELITPLIPSITSSVDEERWKALGDYCTTHLDSPTCGGKITPTPDYSDWASRHIPTQAPISKAQSFCTANFTPGTKDYDDCVIGYNETVTVPEDTTLVVNSKTNNLSKTCRQTIQEDCTCITDDTCIAHAYQLISYVGAENRFVLPPVPPFDIKAPLPAYGKDGIKTTSAYVKALPNFQKDDIVGVGDVSPANIDSLIHDTNVKVVRTAISDTSFYGVERQFSQALQTIEIANNKGLEPRLVLESYNLPDPNEFDQFLNNLKTLPQNKLPSAIIFGNEVGGNNSGHPGDLTDGDIRSGKQYTYFNGPQTLLSDTENGLPAYIAKLYKTAKEIETTTGKKIEVTIPSTEWNFHYDPENLKKYYGAMQKAGVNLDDPNVTVDMHVWAPIDPPFPNDDNGPARIMEVKKILAELGHPNTNIVVGEMYYGNDWSPDQMQRYINYYKQIGVKKITLYGATGW